MTQGIWGLYFYPPTDFMFRFGSVVFGLFEPNSFGVCPKLM